MIFIFQWAVGSGQWAVTADSLRGQNTTSNRFRIVGQYFEINHDFLRSYH
jgi:hypothetical protein